MKEFKSKHSFSLYEQFKSKGNGKMWKFNAKLEDLRKWTNTDDKYPKTTLWKKNVLDKVLLDLENSDLPLVIESVVKKGNKIIGWKLKMDKNLKKIQKRREEFKEHFEKEFLKIKSDTPKYWIEQEWGSFLKQGGREELEEKIRDETLWNSNNEYIGI